MTLFKTTDEQRAACPGIAAEMRRASLPDDLVAGWLVLAEVDGGLFELGELWLEEEDDGERGELLAAIRGVVDEAAALSRS